MLYTNPNHVSPLSPVVGFHSMPQTINDVLTGYVMKPNKGGAIPSNAVILYMGANANCSDPTHVSKPATVPNAINAPIPVYNHCPTPQLIGYIGSVVKNSAVPTSSVMMML